MKIPRVITTMAALLGALPLAFGRGADAELRAPLGIAIAGGLVFSQVLTLYGTPVIYVWFERAAAGIRRLRSSSTRGGRHQLSLYW